MQDTHGKQAWPNFSGSNWKKEINVRDFIVSNVTSYSGVPEFLAQPSAHARRAKP